jgi:hypothetical protein
MKQTTHPMIEVARTHNNVHLEGLGITVFLIWETGGLLGDEYECTVTGDIYVGDRTYQLYRHWSCAGNDIAIMDGNDIAGTFKYSNNIVTVNL